MMSFLIENITDTLLWYKKNKALPDVLLKKCFIPSMFNCNCIFPDLVIHSDPDKHYLMYDHERVPIAVCEREPSSIIAFALR